MILTIQFHCPHHASNPSRSILFHFSRTDTLYYQMLEVMPRRLTVYTLKNAVFWDVMLCGSCTNRCFRGAYPLHHQDAQLLGTANVPSLLIIFSLIMVIRSSETSVLIRTIWCNILEDGILHSHYHENLKSYNIDIALLCYCSEVVQKHVIK
jgi:hypothetical protein